MKNLQLLSLIAITIGSLSHLPLSAQDKNNSHEPHNADASIEEVLVTGVLQKTQKDTALPINILSGEALRDNAAATIGDTLQSLVGVNSASFGVGVGQPVIRGQSANRVQVLQNGTGSLDVSNTSQDHANTVEGLLAKRIEVVRGPATLLYGNGAIGGVVNVIDNRIPKQVPGGLSGDIEYRYETGNDGSTFVAVLDGGSGNFAWHLDGVMQDTGIVEIPGIASLEAEHEEGGHAEDGHAEEEHEDEATLGFIGNSNTEKLNLTAGGSYITDRGFIGVSVNQYNNEYGLPPGAHGHEEEHADEMPDAGMHMEGEEEEEEVIRLDMEQTRIDINAEYDVSEMGNGWFNQLTASLTSNDYTHTELEGDEIGTVFENKGLELRTNLSHGNRNDALKGSIGLQLLQRDFSAVGEEAFIPVSDISGMGIYAIESLERGDYIFEGGLRLDRQTIDTLEGCNSRETSLSASLASIWNYSDDANLLVSFNRSQRSASVEELYSNIGFGCVESSDPEDYVAHAATSRFEIGDPDLEKETATNFEIAYRKHSGRIRGEASFFINNVKDYVYLADVDEFEETIVSRYLQDDVRLLGAEIEVDIPVFQWSDNQYLDVHLFADYVEAELSAGPRVGTYLPKIPPLRTGLVLSYAQNDWKVKLSNTHVSEQAKTSFNETPTESYNRIDLFLDYHWHLGDKDLLLFAKVKNITDQEIRNHLSFLKDFAPEPGRSVQLGMRYSF